MYDKLRRPCACLCVRSRSFAPFRRRDVADILDRVLNVVAASASVCVCVRVWVCGFARDDDWGTWFIRLFGKEIHGRPKPGIKCVWEIYYAVVVERQCNEGLWQCEYIWEWWGFFLSVRLSLSNRCVSQWPPPKLIWTCKRILRLFWQLVNWLMVDNISWRKLRVWAIPEMGDFNNEREKSSKTV